MYLEHLMAKCRHLTIWDGNALKPDSTRGIFRVLLNIGGQDGLKSVSEIFTEQNDSSYFRRQENASLRR